MNVDQSSIYAWAVHLLGGVWFFMEPHFLWKTTPKPHSRLKKAQTRLRGEKLSLKLNLGGESTNPTSKGTPQPPLRRKSFRGAWKSRNVDALYVQERMTAHYIQWMPWFCFSLFLSLSFFFSIRVPTKLVTSLYGFSPSLCFLNQSVVRKS